MWTCTCRTLHFIFCFLWPRDYLSPGVRRGTNKQKILSFRLTFKNVEIHIISFLSLVQHILAIKQSFKL